MIGKRTSARNLQINVYHILLIVLSFFVSYSQNYVNEDIEETMKLIPFSEQQTEETIIKLIQDNTDDSPDNNINDELKKSSLDESKFINSFLGKFDHL